MSVERYSLFSVRFVQRFSPGLNNAFPKSSHFIPGQQKQACGSGHAPRGHEGSASKEISISRRKYEHQKCWKAELHLIFAAFFICFQH